MTTELDNRRSISAAVVVGVWVAIHLAGWLLPSVFEPLRAQATDLLFAIRGAVPALQPEYDGTVVHVDIDDRSVQLREEFYVGRAEHARLVENLSNAGVATQLHDVIFAAPQPDSGDEELIRAAADAENVYFGMALGLSRETTRTDVSPTAEQAALLDASRWPIAAAPRFLSSNLYFMTFPRLASAAAGLGYLDIVPDRDGVFRRIPLLVRDGDGLLPAIALTTVADFLSVDSDRIDVEPGRSITLRGARRPGDDTARDIAIPIDRRGRMIVNYIGPWSRMTHYPFSEIYEASDDRFAMQDLRDEMQGKLAVVSFVTTGQGDVGSVPAEPVYPLSGIHANVANSILTGEFLREIPTWQMLFLVELPLLLLLLVAALRWPTLPFLLTATGIVGAYCVLAAVAFFFAGRIVDIPGPILAIAGSTLGLAAYNYHVESKGRAKLHRELSVAREIQMDTFPTKMPSIPGYDVYGFSLPADQTGGDSFDIVPLDEHRLFLLLGDATGHGIGPALSVTQVRAMLRIALRLGADLDQALIHINNQLVDDLADNRFVTSFMGIADARTHEVPYHSAGQGPLMHFHAADGSIDWLSSSTMPMGFLTHQKLKAPQPVSMQPGDILGLMTDGIFEYENTDEEQFGEEGVAQLVRKHQSESMSRLAEILLHGVQEFGKSVPQADDITILLIRRMPA